MIKSHVLYQLSYGLSRRAVQVASDASHAGGCVRAHSRRVNSRACVRARPAVYSAKRATAACAAAMRFKEFITMPIVNRVADLQGEIAESRHDIHAHPELLFDVHRSAASVADKLKAFGCDEVVPGIGRTGVVGVIRGKRGQG